jgi:hypothetical protein
MVADIAGDVVNRTVFPGAAAAVIANDGDTFRFCSTCAFSEACLAQGLDKGALRDLHMLVEHVGPLPAGAHLFRTGDSFDAIAAVRSGTVKTCRVDREGREQVLGFHRRARSSASARSTASATPAMRSRSTTCSCAGSRSRRSRCWLRACPGFRSSFSG